MAQLSDSIERFIKESKTPFALGAESGREIVMFYKLDAVLQREFV